MKRQTALLGLAAVALTATLTVARTGAAQSITLPPSGDNQRSLVRQGIGLVNVEISYSSPDVHAPDGTDRRGKIWGSLVPYGLPNLGFGTCKECPWRAGSNENTVFRFSHDVLVEGKPLAAGSYGFHIIPSADEWTLIFSKNSTSWGSFFYDKSEDALRVVAKPQKNEYREWLTYEFTDRKPDRATVCLMWEDLKLPITIAVPNIDELYYQNLKNELRTSPGFSWQSWNQAAQFLLSKKIHLDDAESWAQSSISAVFVGQENATNLLTLSQAQEANGKTKEAAATFEKAVRHPTGDPRIFHQYARQLQTQGKKEQAFRIYELNGKQFPDRWPVNVGLARAASGAGRFADALKYAKKALEQAPDEGNKKNLRDMIAKLEKNQDVN